MIRPSLCPLVECLEYVEVLDTTGKELENQKSYTDKSGNETETKPKGHESGK